MSELIVSLPYALPFGRAMRFSDTTAYLGISEYRLRRLVDLGVLRHHKHADCVWIDLDSIKAYVKQRDKK